MTTPLDLEAIERRIRQCVEPFGCDAHGIGEGWADTTHAAAVRAVVAR